MHSFGTCTAAPGQPARNIALELRDVSQLFNPIDSSPFENKDLNSDVEEFIVSSAQEYSPSDQLTLRIVLAEWPANDPTKLVGDAVHNYFAYRGRMNRLEFHRLMKRGRTSLVIGLLFLATCLLCSSYLLGDAQSNWTSVIRESLSIAGWVAMWRPMEIYLYDWWPLRRRAKIYEKLSGMSVEVMKKRKA